MGLLHTPRTIVAIARGLLQRRSLLQQLPKSPTTTTSVSSQTSAAAAPLVGFGSDNPHIYQARVGLIDVDYAGHLNNSAYMYHAEYARWQLICANGLLPVMIQKNIKFYVTSSAIRHRQEIRPFYRKFQIETFFAAIDQRNLWLVQNFRYPPDTTSSSSASKSDGKKQQQPQDRLRAQVLLQGVAIKGREVIEPKTFLNDFVDMEEEAVEALRLPRKDDEGGFGVMFERFGDLGEAMRDASSKDDEKCL